MRTSILALIAITSSGCAAYKPIHPPTSSGDPRTLHVLPVLYQEELAVHAVASNNTLLAYGLGGPIGIVAGGLVDSAINSTRTTKAERKAEVIRKASADFDLIAHFEGVVDTKESGTGWTRQQLSEVTGETEIQKLVSETFAASDVDTVVVLTGRYRLTPRVNHVHVQIQQEIYRRGKVAKTSGLPLRSISRVVSYLSPAHDIEFRQLKEGEKELLKRAKSREYEQLIATQPEAEDGLRSALDEELTDLDAATEIPEDRAIAETWTPELLQEYLGQAKSHLLYMLEHDWNEQVRPGQSSGLLERFYGYAPTGARAYLRGRKVTNLNGNTIYRLEDGALYSVPPDVP